LGVFDLDPCQCDPQPWKCAERGFTIAQDGLSREWIGRVWLNPPYSRVWDWMDRLVFHVNGTALIFARTETEGFVRTVWNAATAVMFLHGRLFFHHPDGLRGKSNSGGPSVLVAYGESDAEILKACSLAGTFIRLRPSQIALSGQ